MCSSDLAGYGRYRFYLWNQAAMRSYGHLPKGARDAVAGWIQNSPLLGAAARRKLGHTFLARGGDVESLYLDNFYSGFSQAEQKRMFRLPESNPYAGFRRFWDEASDRPPLARMLYADAHTYLEQLLMKQDRMSMTNSIEKIGRAHV